MVIQIINVIKAILCVIWLIVYCAFFLSGCTDIQYVPVHLSRPERPTLPKIDAIELECLSKDTYQKLIEQKWIKAEYTQKLEAIIDSTGDK